MPSWEPRLEQFRQEERDVTAFADLLESVDSRWYGALRVESGVHLMRLFPPGDSLNKGSSVWIEKTRSGFSMEIRFNPGMTMPRTVVRRRATLATAPTTLASLLDELFEGRDIPSSRGREAEWSSVVDRFRAYGRAAAFKADLLSPLASKWAEACEIYDNGQAFGVMRVGDEADDGKAVWITPTGDGCQLRLVSQSRREGSQVIREVTAGLRRVVGLLDELLAEMTADVVVTDTTAQQAYHALLRDFVGPWLRRQGYKGSSGAYHRSVGDYKVAIAFQKSKWSTKKKVDYWLNLSVSHPETAQMYRRANDEARTSGREHEVAPAGSWSSTFPGGVGPPRGRISLRPGDDLSTHADQLLGELDHVVFPEIQRQLDLPLSTPTLPSRRAMAPGREESNRAALRSTLAALRAGGADVDVPEDLDVEGSDQT